VGSRSRVLLENVALKLGLGWIDVVKFERRITKLLEIQEGVEKLDAVHPGDLIDELIEERDGGALTVSNVILLARHVSRAVKQFNQDILERRGKQFVVKGGAHEETLRL
jgi:hypothetical protein